MTLTLMSVTGQTLMAAFLAYTDSVLTSQDRIFVTAQRLDMKVSYVLGDKACVYVQ